LRRPALARRGVTRDDEEVLAAVLDVSLDYPLLVYHFLEIVFEKIIEGVKLVARNMLP